jgi:hypothetical protein
MSRTNTAAAEPSWLQLESIKSMKECEEITGLSRDTLKRRYPKLVKRLSDKRLGMQLKHLLAIAAGE